MTNIIETGGTEGEPVAWRFHHVTQPGKWQCSDLPLVEDPYIVVQPLYAHPTTTPGRVTVPEGMAPRKWAVERADQDDGSITYHIFEVKPDYRWVVGLNDSEDSTGGTAKADAEIIVAGVNALASPSVEEGRK